MHVRYGLRWCALRWFNACGADPDAEIGELRAQETHLIPRVMMCIQGHLNDFRLFGTDYPTPDGTAIRDYIHVCDLAYGHILALQRLLAADVLGVCNLGSGTGHSVRQVLAEIKRVTKADLPVIAAERRRGDPPVLVADPKRAQEALGFHTMRSDLQGIVSDAWAWHQRAHPRRDRPAAE